MIKGNLFLDFAANRESVKGNGKELASTIGLVEQYSHLADEDFSTFLVNLCEDELHVYISIPSMNREITQKDYGSFYSNCAIRIERDNRDLVLLGDIFERVKKTWEGNTVTERTYKVKSILYMDSSLNHYGELECLVKPFIKEGQFWMDSQGKDFQYLDSLNNKNIFTDTFINELKKSKPLPDFSKAQNMLGDWSDYLESREIKIQTEEKLGYDLAKDPEFITAYVHEKKKYGAEEWKELQESSDRIGFINRNDTVCTKIKTDDRCEERLLSHLCVDILLPEYTEFETGNHRKNGFKEKFDSFTRSPCKLSPPSNGKDSKREKSIQFYDKRFSTSEIEKILPEEHWRRIDDQTNIRISQATTRNSRDLSNENKKLLNDFITNKLDSKISEYIEDERPAATKRVTAQVEEQSRKIEKNLEKEMSSAKNELSMSEGRLKKASAELSDAELKLSKTDSEPKKNEKESKALQKRVSELTKEIEKLNDRMDELEDEIDQDEKLLDNISDRFDINELIEDELNRLSEEKRKELTEEQNRIIRRDIEPNFNRELKRTISDIRTEADAEKEEVRKAETVVRLHVFFEIEVDDEQSIASVQKELIKKYRPDMKLCKDLAGDKAIIDRQKNALTNLLNGNAMNPYLTLSLFSPGSSGSNTLMRIEPEKLDGLNKSQKQVVTKALSSNGMFLIQGPPGTGKTEVIARIAALLAENGKKVLIASENNKAVDNAFSRLKKVPSIRPVRLIRDKNKRKDNPYAPEYLVSNFYSNISHSLREEVDKYENYEYFMEQIEDSVESLEYLMTYVENLRIETEDVEKRIQSVRDELDTEYQNLKINNENNLKLDSEIEKDNDYLEGLKTPEDSVFEDIAESVGDRFGLEYKSPKYQELALTLMDMEPMDILDAMDLYEEHSELMKLMREKASISADDYQGILDLNKEIRHYEDTHDVTQKDLKMFTLFGDDVPDIDELNDFKLEIEKALKSKIDKTRKHIENLKKLKKDNSALNMKIRNLNTELERLKTDPSYRRLEEANKEFDRQKIQIFDKLHTSERPGDPQQAISVIKEEIWNQKASYDTIGNEIESRISTYRRICKYIDDPEVPEKDYESYAMKLFSNVNIIGITCTSKNRTDQDDPFEMDLKNQNIDTVIIDEVSKVSFVELLQPILLGKTIILVGDHKQLPPMYNKIPDEEIPNYDSPLISSENEERFKTMYETSFFDNLFRKSPENVKETLTIQYRMHPDIMDIDNVFYDGALSFGGSVADKNHYLTIKGTNGKTIISPDTHVLFIDTKGQEIRESGSSSFKNELEAEVVGELLKRIDQSCTRDSKGEKLGTYHKGKKDTRLSAGVICTYADQTRLVKRYSRGAGFKSFCSAPDERFMVKSVDDFQGDERDIIILSMVRTRNNCSFLAKFNRINVAISRARRLLVIVGNAYALEHTLVDMGNNEKKYIYRDMIMNIKRKNGFISSADVIGGGY